MVKCIGHQTFKMKRQNIKKNYFNFNRENAANSNRADGFTIRMKRPDQEEFKKAMSAEN